MSRRFNQTQELDHFNKDELLAMKSMIEEKIQTINASSMAREKDNFDNLAEELNDSNLVEELNNLEDEEVDEYYDENFLSLVEEIDTDYQNLPQTVQIRSRQAVSKPIMILGDIQPQKAKNFQVGVLEEQARLTGSLMSQGDIYEITKSNSQVYDY